jgi:hypothetical protein
MTTDPGATRASFYRQRRRGVHLAPTCRSDRVGSFPWTRGTSPVSLQLLSFPSFSDKGTPEARGWGGGGRAFPLPAECAQPVKSRDLVQWWLQPGRLQRLAHFGRPSRQKRGLAFGVLPSFRALLSVGRSSQESPLAFLVSGPGSVSLWLEGWLVREEGWTRGFFAPRGFSPGFSHPPGRRRGWCWVGLG